MRMPVSKGPDWSTPARLNGLPAKNWKSREGVTLCAPLSACLTRWLDLHPSDRISTSLGWGPNSDGDHGCWERPNIVGFLVRNGPPPEMGEHVTIEHIKTWLAFDCAPVREIGDLESQPGTHHLMVWSQR
jgi:hypothetical protein